MTLANGQSTAIDTDHSLSSGKPKLDSVLKRVLHYISTAVLGGVRHVEPNMVPVALCAAIMFPAYWFVWKFLFPQPYENLGIRLVGSLLCFAIAAKDRWPMRLRKYLPIAWLGTVLYSGPFFFTFMLLQNSNSTVWLMSTMAGLFLVVLLLDWISLFVLFIAGSLIAWRVHLLLSPVSTSLNLYLEYVPIFLFALTAGTIFNYKAAGLRQAKERARLELGALLAKEMQVPLISMRTNAASLGKFLPDLIRAYREAGMPQKLVSASLRMHLSALERVPTRIDEAIDEVTSIIEMLMTEGGEVATGRWCSSSMLRCLDDAIAGLPVTGELDRARIIVDRQYDFLFYGSPILMRYILARVIEASLNDVYVGTGAELLVTLGKAGTRNYLRLTDSSEDLRGKGRLLSRFARSDRDFTKRPDLALADFVLGRMEGFVTHIVVRGQTEKTVLWFTESGS
jgi:hypothetical protein